MSLRAFHPVFVIAVLAGSGPALAQRADVARAETLVLEATNEFRREEGVGTVRANLALAKAAREFAQYMAGTGRYGHTADGRNPADRAHSYGYDHCLVAENIAYQYRSDGFRTAELAHALVEGWKRSPEHRRNMLEPAATETAVAVAQSERSGRYYAVQMFGRPKSERIEFRVANAAPQPVRYRVAGQDYSLRPRETRIHWTCGLEDVALQSVAGAPLRPGNGDKLVVRSEANGLAIRRER